MGDDTTYEDAGVDISAGDRCSAIAYETCKRTYANRDGRFGTPAEFKGGFAGPVQVDAPLEDAVLVKNSDGIGSKVLVAQRVGRHDTVAHDLVAMNVDDTITVGAEPVAGTNSLDVADADVELVEELMRGLEDACEDAGIAMVGGEIAELGEQVTGYRTPYVWNADVLGVVEKGRIIDGSAVAAGDAVIGIRSNGIRSNGLTLARRICREAFGDEWHEETMGGSERWGDVLLKPSRICCGAVLDCIGRYGEEPAAPVSGMAHVTGGGVTNLERVLGDGQGAVLDELFEPQQEFLALQERGPVADEEAYRTWNMGQCFLLTTPEPEKTVEVLADNDAEAKVVGRVTEGDELRVASRGRDGETLTFR